LPQAVGTLWSLRRPLHVQALVTVSLFVILAGLAWVLPLLALALVALLWCTRHHARNGLFNPSDVLQVGGSQWCLFDAGGNLKLANGHALHLWNGPAWKVLRLQGVSPEGKLMRYDATLWRASASPQAWRQLHDLTARLAAQASIIKGAP